MINQDCVEIQQNSPSFPPIFLSDFACKLELSSFLHLPPPPSLHAEDEKDKDQEHELENFSTQLTQLPSSLSSIKSSRTLSSSSSSCAISNSNAPVVGSVSKRALALIGNIKPKKNLEAKPQTPQISLRRSHSFPNDPSSHHQPLRDPSDENGNSYPSTIASESDLDHQKPLQRGSVSGFKKFQQIVQTANQSSKKSSLPIEYSQRILDRQQQHPRPLHPLHHFQSINSWPLPTASVLCYSASSNRL
jgi:hypothetical protein